DALAELPNLIARIVDVVFPLHVVAALLEQPRQRITVRTPPAISDVNRTGRIGGDELDEHTLARAHIVPRILVNALREDLRENLVQEGRIQLEVDETPAGDVHRSHSLRQVRLEVFDELLRQSRGLPAVFLCDNHRYVACEVAKPLVASALDPDGFFRNTI